MQQLTRAQREQWAIDGYIRVERALSPGQVAFFDAELDRIRQLPGWEPSPDGPLGHYAWLDHAVDRDPEGFLYNYCQLFLRTYDPEPTPEVLERCTPRQRRLLGDLGYDFRPGSYFYAPQDQVDVIAGEGA